MNKVKSILVLVLILAAGMMQSCDSESQAQSNMIDFTIDLAGATVVDPPGEDGSAKSVTTFNGISNTLGPNTVTTDLLLQAMGENCTTPNGTPGIILSLVQGSLIITQTGTNDQIFAAFTSFDLCTSFMDPAQSTNSTAVIIGGTGQFQNATGQITSVGTGNVVAPDGSFLGQSVTANGTIELN